MVKTAGDANAESEPKLNREENEEDLKIKIVKLGDENKYLKKKVEKCNKEMVNSENENLKTEFVNFLQNEVSELKKKVEILERTITKKGYEYEIIKNERNKLINDMHIEKAKSYVKQEELYMKKLENSSLNRSLREMERESQLKLKEIWHMTAVSLAVTVGIVCYAKRK